MSDSQGPSSGSGPKQPNLLKKQLEETRFERALEVVHGMADMHVFLNTAELGRINNILLGETKEPWRQGAAVCALKSGREARFQVLADPQKNAREILTYSKEKALNGQVIEAAADLYADLVLNHVFEDANRRTAVIAACYLLHLHGYEISAQGVHDLGLGDLSVSGQREKLKDAIKGLIKVTPIKKT